MASCRHCDTTWTSLVQLHCAQCHRQFGGEDSFTRHRDWGRCVPAPAGMTDGVYYSAEEYAEVVKMKKARRSKDVEED